MGSMLIGILGAGNVGRTLGQRWLAAGHEVRFGVRNPSDPKHAGQTVVGLKEAGEAEILVLTVPFSAVEATLQGLGDLSGKVVIDATNPIAEDFSGLSVGYPHSGADVVAANAPGAHVVKAFNTVGFNIMEDPAFGSEAAAMLVAGDHAGAKQRVIGLANDLGFVGLDAGPLSQATLLEAQAWLWITMAVKYGYGRDIAFRLLRR